ncbi:YfcL family protein [Vibrio sp. SS-MA-C1-2]|uniref:YfcL family protein n=1 Tax=Vibrio sp. SS-MA-C1-2 TaxID=2908646 RepID=UPI001F37982C|nr:YfcL family protein [Vibrio sp. SS-MA-C1-2]UJF20170.1 YfcL family protein [Vibrio sp. SS-MA-C1-2]
MTIQDYEEKLMDMMDAMVETSTEDQLFANGYLRGHISLAAASCELENIEDLDIFKQQVLESVTANQNELTPADFALVVNCWNELQK